MLCYKAWLESRSRYLISLIGITLVCVFYILRWDQEAMPDTRQSYYSYGVAETGAILVPMWSLAVVLLMMGGILREKAIGSSEFTLALPVSRRRITATRILVGLAEAVSLAVVPWLGILITNSFFGLGGVFTQGFFSLLLLIGGGSVFFALAVFASSLVEGEYTAPIASLGAIVVLTGALSSQDLRPYSPLRFMLALDYRDPHSGALIGTIPWLQAAVYCVLAAGIVLLSVKAVERREF